MMIIDNVKQPGYTQWVEGFISCILANSNIKATVAIINDMNNKRIYLMVDGREHMIRTMNFFPVKKDQNGLTCSEDVEYELYIGHEYCDFPEDPVSLNLVSSGILNIEWINDPELLKAEYEQYIALHGEPEKREKLEEGAYMMVHVTDLNQGHFDLKMDIRPLSSEELLAVADYFTNGDMSEVLNTPKMLRYLKSVHEACVDNVIDFCFDGGVYDHDYTKRLIAGCVAYRLCCADCAYSAFSSVCNLYEEYQNGNESALNFIKANLDEFFRNIAPYSITIE